MPGEARSNCNKALNKKGKVAYKYFQDFSDATTLHGVRYVGEPKRHPIERFFWGVAIVVCTLWCCVQIQQLWTRWQTSPVIVSLAETSTKIWDIPFPAITICPENHIWKSRFDIKQAVETGDNLSLSSNFDWQTVSIACKNVVRAKEYDSDFNSNIENDMLNSSHLQHLFELGPDMGDVIQECEWGISEESCLSNFRPLLTDHGVCFTFNLLHDKDLYTSQTESISPPEQNTDEHINTTWNPDTGYKKDVDLEDSYPLRAISNGRDSGLKLLLRVRPEEMQPLCNGDAQSLMMVVHAVSEFPQVSSQFVRLPLDSTVTIAVRPDMITTAQPLSHHQPDLRGCYFPHEKNLTYFKIYSQQNCETECLAFFVNWLCECQISHLPKTVGSNATYCSEKHAECIKLIDSEIHKLLASTTDYTDYQDFQFCKCLPSCSQFTYDLELSSSQFNITNDLRFDVNTSMYRYIEVAVFFKDAQFIHSHRSELYTTIDFLANCGGLLGLFTGFSITSAIEICYFLSLRIWCNVWTHRQRKVAANERDLNPV